jgi:hypothetical protein
MEHIPSTSRVQVKSSWQIVEGYTVRDAKSDHRPLIKITSTSGKLKMTSLWHGKYRECAPHATERFGTTPVYGGSDLDNWEVNHVAATLVLTYITRTG